MNEKRVIEGLRHCYVYKLCNGCPYNNVLGGCHQKVAEDAIALLQGQISVAITEDFVFGEWMIDTMEEQGVTVKRLAELSTLTEPGIRNVLYEYRRPRIDTMFLITKALCKKIMIVNDIKDTKIGE